jgi:Skp family chaperone for outer membrane proteins
MAFAVMPALCAAQDKTIAKVDISEIQKKSGRVNTAVHELRQIELESRVVLQKISSEIAEIERKLRDDKDKLTKEQTDALEVDLKERKEALENEQQAARARIAFKRKSVETATRQQISEAIAKAAKEEGVKAVIPSFNLVYSDGLHDLTPKVIQFLDEVGSETGKKE